MLNAHRESHNAAQPHFAALPLLILFSSAGFTMGCAGSTGGTGATSPIVPPLPPPPSVIVTIALATASLLLGNAETFTATVTGTKNTTVSWNVNGVAGGNPAIGTITAAGVYTAPVDLPLAPAVQITATSNSDPTKSANATLTITSDIAIALSPATASVILGASQPFRAAIVSNGRPDTTVRWSISGPACPSACGSLDANGNYTAPQILPTLTNVTVTAQSVADPSKQASATIAILSDVTVSLTPTAIGVELGAIQPFHAAINSSGSPNTAIRWSIAGPACPAVCGSLDASGNYTAPQTLPASATLTLTAQSVADPSKQASAAITITSNFSLQLSAPSSVASGASSIIAATLTPVPGSNPNTTLSWTLTGAGCSRTSCGVLAVATTQPLGGGATSTSATYTAPATPPSPNTVAITVTPQSDPSKKASANLTIQPGAGVTLSPGTATLAANHRVTLTAQVFGSANSAVAWTVNGFANGTGTVGQICIVSSIPCQPLGTGNNLQVDYQAPGAIPAPNPVTVRTSLADSTRRATAQITVINHDVVTVQPSTVTLAPLAAQQFSATVLGTSNQTVIWQIQGTACSVSGACGAINANGVDTARGSAPDPDSLTVVAISNDDPSQSGVANPN